MSTTFILIRHAQSLSNTRSVAAGKLDEGLSKLGIEQAELLGKYLSNRKIDSIYSSPKLRAVQTAEIIKFHQKKYNDRDIPLTLHTDLREIDHGIYEGLGKIDFLKLSHQDFYNLENCPGKFDPPNGEAGYLVYRRMKNTLLSLASTNDERTIAVVSHGFFISTAIGFAEGKDELSFDRFLVANSSINELIIDKSGTTNLIATDFCPHLNKNLQTPPIELRGRFAKLNL